MHNCFGVHFSLHEGEAIKSGSVGMTHEHGWLYKMLVLTEVWLYKMLVLRCGCSVLFARSLSVCAEKKVSELCDVDCFVTALVNLRLYATLPEEDECVEEEMRNSMREWKEEEEEQEEEEKEEEEEENTCAREGEEIETGEKDGKERSEKRRRGRRGRGYRKSQRLWGRKGSVLVDRLRDCVQTRYVCQPDVCGKDGVVYCLTDYTL